MPAADHASGKWPKIKDYMARIAARPKVQETMKAEGLLKG